MLLSLKHFSIKQLLPIMQMVLGMENIKTDHTIKLILTSLPSPHCETSPMNPTNLRLPLNPKNIPESSNTG